MRVAAGRHGRRSLEGRKRVDTTLQVTVPARWEATATSRQSIATWLRAHRWPPDGVDDALLAVNEAVNNSIEHGYRVTRDDNTHPGIVSVIGRVELADQGRFTRFEVRDHGLWRTDQHDPTGIRSRGLIMIRAVMRELEVHTGPEGTLVRMTSHFVPAAPPLLSNRGTGPSRRP